MSRTASPGQADAKFFAVAKAFAPGLHSAGVGKYVGNLRGDRVRLCAKYAGQTSQRNVEIELAGHVIFRHYLGHAWHRSNNALKLLIAFDDDSRRARVENRRIADKLDCIAQSLLGAKEDCSPRK